MEEMKTTLGKFFSVLCVGTASVFCLQGSEAHAQNIPNSAEAGRLPQKPASLPHRPQATIAIPSDPQTIGTKPPAEAATIMTRFENIEISGATLLSQNEIASIKHPYLHKEIPLSELWALADAITRQYRDRGYFLSRAYIPAQEIDSAARIEVVEGYVSEVTFPEKYKKDSYLLALRQRLTQQRPISAQSLERELLLLNDASSEEFQARLEALGDKSADHGIRLVLETQTRPQVSGSISVNNYGSRYMGPYQTNGSVNIHSGKRQQTTLFGGVTPNDEMKHIYARHAVSFAAGWEASAYAAYSNAVPGYSLKDDDIESDSRTLGVELIYAAIRQRTHNLDLRINIEGRNVDSDVQDSALTRDRVRALRLGARFENYDRWRGSNTFDLTFSHGLDLFGNSEAGDRDLSRASAAPDFRKLEISLQRVQMLGESWVATASASGQYAFDPLYSSEEFGYGGIGFGRAYDSSELLGDSGFAAAFEIGYNGLPTIGKAQLQPFVFVDTGKLWNHDAGQEDEAAAHSTGFGLHAIFGDALRADATIAFPIDRPAEAPLSGNSRNPRILTQLQYLF